MSSTGADTPIYVAIRQYTHEVTLFVNTLDMTGFKVAESYVDTRGHLIVDLAPRRSQDHTRGVLTYPQLYPVLFSGFNPPLESWVILRYPYSNPTLALSCVATGVR